MSETTDYIILFSEEKVQMLDHQLTNIREEYADNKYIQEARRVLMAGGHRSAIGAYWNAVVDDLRKKITHRSLDLFNKEMKFRKEIKTYEDFQTHVTENDLIEGAYKIGVIGWEAQKLLHQARETRNIFYGHPDSSDPTIFKVFDMISDCNRYVLSVENPQTIIIINDYILNMDSEHFHKNEMAVEQAFSDLPEIYKNEMINRLFSIYIGENASTRLKANIEFGLPILWKVLTKADKQLIGKRFDKLIVEGNILITNRGIDFLTLIDGLRYVSIASRRVLYEPSISKLEQSLDDWDAEGAAVQALQRLGSTIPEDLILRYVQALTLTFVGYKGTSYRYNRSDFYSNTAAPMITEMFKDFDNTSIESFISIIKNNEILYGRIRHGNQRARLQTLGQILLAKKEIREDSKIFLEALIDNEKLKEFRGMLNVKS